MTLFVINADPSDVHELTLDVRAFSGYKFAEHAALYSADPNACNDYENPNVLQPVAITDTTCENGILTAILQPMSWNMIRFTRA